MQVFLQLYVLFAISCILLFSPLKLILADNFLKLILLLIVYSGICRIMADIYPGLPGLFSVSVFAAHLLFTPGIYLYLRNQVYGRSLDRSDRIHLLPFLIFCAGCIISYAVSENNNFWLNAGWIASEAVNSRSTTLLFTLLFGVTAFYFALVLLVLRHKSEIANPGVAFGQNMVIVTDTFSNGHPSETAVNGQRNALLTEEKVRQIDEVVIRVLEEKKPFLQQRYSLKDLSDDTQIPLHQLSAYINKHCGKNFNDFINEFRVQYCKEKILNQECRNKKLEAVAEESGFNNRNTFAIAFKKVTGINPSQFLKEVKSVVEEEEGNPEKRRETRVLPMPGNVYRDVLRS